MKSPPGLPLECLSQRGVSLSSAEGPFHPGFHNSIDFREKFEAVRGSTIDDLPWAKGKA